MDLEGAEEMDRGLSTSAHSANATSMSKERTIYYRELVIIFAGIGEDLRPWGGSVNRGCHIATEPSFRPLHYVPLLLFPSEPAVRPLACSSADCIRTAPSSVQKMHRPPLRCLTPRCSQSSLSTQF